MHCTFARSFNEHPNSLSLRTLICNTLRRSTKFPAEHLSHLLPFLSPYSSCTVFWVSIFHLSVNIVVLHQFTVPGHWSRISKTSYLKLKREVIRSLSDGKKVQDCYYVFGSLMMFQRRKEWICKSRCRQVSVRLHVFAGFFCP